MSELWLAIVLECWFIKSRDELGRYGYTNDREGFFEAMGFSDKIEYDSFKDAWL